MGAGRSGTTMDQTAVVTSFIEGAWVLEENYSPGTAKKVASSKKEDETTKILKSSAVSDGALATDSKPLNTATTEPVKFETRAIVGGEVFVRGTAAVSAPKLPKQSFFNKCCPCWSKPSVDDSKKAETNIQLSSGKSSKK